MFNRLGHHFSKTVPVLLLGSVALGVWRLTENMRRIAGGGVVSGLSALVGEGIDEFSVRLGSTGSVVSSMVADSNTWISLTAFVATGITVITSVRQLTDSVHSSGDAAAFLRHVSARLACVAGSREVPVSWGVIHDAQTGEPLPYARVEILDGSGAILATSVADRSGAFGFSVPYAVINRQGGVGLIAISKGGYKSLVMKPQIDTQNRCPFWALPLRRSAHVGYQEEVRPSAIKNIALAASFWGGVLTVPIVLLASPGITTAVLASMFGAAAALRAFLSSGKAR